MSETGYDIMQSYCISEYEKYLEGNNIDTVCFMGYGYKFEDVKVGAEFYISYLFWCKRSDHKRSASLSDCLRQCLIATKFHYPNIELTDKFKLIQKYKYANTKSIVHSERTFHDTKARREFVRIQNLRTGEILDLNEDWIDSFHLFLFDTW